MHPTRLSKIRTRTASASEDAKTNGRPRNLRESLLFPSPRKRAQEAITAFGSETQNFALTKSCSGGRYHRRALATEILSRACRYSLLPPSLAPSRDGSDITKVTLSCPVDSLQQREPFLRTGNPARQSETAAATCLRLAAQGPLWQASWQIKNTTGSEWFLKFIRISDL